jgi:hypothetical protein
MTGHLECNARAALCRQLAELEPDSRNIWLSEAERWSHLTQKPAVASRYRRPADTWCWKIIRRARPRRQNDRSKLLTLH